MVTGHRSQVTGHRSQVTGHRSQVTGFIIALLIPVFSLFADISIMQKIGSSDSPTNNQVMPHFQVTNNNTTSLNLKDIVIKMGSHFLMPEAWIEHC